MSTDAYPANSFEAAKNAELLLDQTVHPDSDHEMVMELQSAAQVWATLSVAAAIREKH